MPQAQPRHQLTLQDSKMLERQLLLKQLQELQKQNYSNQQSEILTSANAIFMPHGASASVQGFSNGMFSQPQRQDHFLANNYNHYSHLQGLSPEIALAFTKGSNNQAENSSMQSLYGKPFLAVTQNMSTDGAFQSKQYSNEKNLFGQVRNEGFHQMNTTAQKVNSRQDQTGSYEQYQGKITKIDSSKGETTLDPVEQKVLFNMDDNGWSSSFARNTEGYTNKSECSDYLNSFPSLQSGSWSALMQSAVGESSSDNGAVQEEWSDLSYQNTELSMDNQHSNNADVGNQQTDWVDNNVTSSLNCEPQNALGGINMSSVFSGFQFPNKHREATHSDSSHESVQESPEVAEKWLDCNFQQEAKAFPSQGFQLSDGNSDQRSIFAKSHDQTSTPPSFGSSMELRMQQGNLNVTSVAGSFYTKNQQQKEYSSSAAVDRQSPQATSRNIANKLPPFDLFIPGDASQLNSSLDQVGQQYSILEASSRKPPSLWPNASSQTRPFGTGPGEIPSNPLNAYVQSLPRIVQGQHEQKNLGENSLREPGVGLTNSQNLFHGEEHYETMSAYQRALSEGVNQTTLQTAIFHGLEPVSKHLSEEFNVGTGTHGDENQMPSVSASDFEAFGRSLKPSNLHPNYSDSSEIKHEMGSVSGPSTSIFVNPYTSRDANIQSIKPSFLPLPQNTAEEMGRQGSFSHTDQNVSDVAFHRTDHSQVNMHMASWFKKYGDMKNVQMLSMFRTAKNSTNPSPLGKHLENLEMKTLMAPLDITGDRKDTVTFPPPTTLPPDFGDTDLSIIRSRKRKTAHLLPWHMEITKSSKRLQSISMAEMEWAKAGNRLIDKVDYEVNMTKDVHPLLPPKKRLVRTTQLMQLVFMPSPAAIFRGKATSNYGSLTYFSAKLALGDACNLNSWPRNGSGLSCSSDNMMTEDSKPSEKASEKLLSTIVEAFTSRAEKLEADLLRLDKTASVLNVIMKCMELEKFSMINRFAKFHFRGQPNATETSTSSGPTSSLLKPGPLRYVQALRPRALPGKAKCLAL